MKASETGALGAGSSSPEVRANTPPVLEVQGPRRIEVKVGEAVPLVVQLQDDGLPKARAIGAGAAVENAGSSATLSSNAAQVSKQIEALRTRRLMLPPQRVTVGKIVGLHVGWHVYRGAGDGEVRPRPDRGVGRHAHRRQLAVGAALGGAAAARRRQGDHDGVVLHARASTSCARVPTMAHSPPTSRSSSSSSRSPARRRLTRRRDRLRSATFLPCS